MVPAAAGSTAPPALAEPGAGWAEGAGAAASGAPVPSMMASRSPMLSLSPSLTFSSLSTPAAGDGISIEALSDSTVTSDCSALMVSPALASNSITTTSLKSPMSGTCTSTGPLAAAGAGAGAAGAGAAAAAGAAAGAGAAAVAEAPPSPSSVSTSEPCLTLSPSCTLISFTTPAAEDGISMEALSDSTVISDCSATTLSPGLTSSSMTVTSSKSPMSGT